MNTGADDHAGADDHGGQRLGLTVVKTCLVILLMSRRFRVKLNQNKIQKPCILLLLQSYPSKLSVDSIQFLVPHHTHFLFLYWDSNAYLKMSHLPQTAVCLVLVIANPGNPGLDNPQTLSGWADFLAGPHLLWLQ